MSARPKYTPAQLTHYLDRLRIPPAARHADATTLAPPDALAYLALLQKHHLAAIPFENLSLHYSPHHRIALHPQHLFAKIIGDAKGRGGYCMEANELFGTLLRTLGFEVYAAGARVWAGTWTGWSHMVNLVTVGERKYHVDVAFGADGPVVPMPLDRSGAVQQHIEPARARLQWRNIPGNADPGQRLWVYEHRRHHGAEWHVKYCFTELEFLPSDYNMMNYYVSTSNKTFFTRDIIVDKKLLDERGELAGSLIMSNTTLKWRMHGEKTKEIEFKTEEDRLQALEQHFGIRFGAAEREGISGLSSQLKST